MAEKAKANEAEKTGKKEAEIAVSEKDKEKKLQKQIMWLFIILCIVFVSFLIARQLNLFWKNPCFEYEGFKICRVRLGESDIYYYSIPIGLLINGEEKSMNVVLRNNPQEIENLTYSVNQSLFDSKKIWLTMDPTYSAMAVDAAFEVGKFTRNIIPTAFAISSPSNESEAKVITCENATSGEIVISYELGNETYVKSDGNCIHVVGKNYEEMKMASDKLAFEWLLTLKQ